MRVLALAGLVVIAPSIAAADEPTPPAGEPAGQPTPPAPPEPPPARPQPPAPPQPLPMPEKGGPPKRGFQIQGRMATQLGIASLVSPGFSLGYRRGNWVFGAELGITAGKLEDTDNNTTDSFSLVTLMPMVYYGLWDSRDGRARLDLVGGIGAGKGKLTSESMGMTTESSAEVVPLLFGVGGDYYLHKNFALGVEVSIYLPVLGKVEDGGNDVGLKGATQSIHGLLRFTFVTGE